jgi:hypothetical protein
MPQPKKPTEISAGFSNLFHKFYFNNSFTNPGVAKLAVWMSSL